MKKHKRMMDGGMAKMGRRVPPAAPVGRGQPVVARPGVKTGPSMPVRGVDRRPPVPKLPERSLRGQMSGIGKVTPTGPTQTRPSRGSGQYENDGPPMTAQQMAGILAGGVQGSPISSQPLTPIGSGPNDGGPMTPQQQAALDVAARLRAESPGREITKADVAAAMGMQPGPLPNQSFSGMKRGGAVKSKAMRGGGLARKGVGVALRGGGLARKGVGMALAKGGLAKRAGGCAKRGVGRGKMV